MEDTIYISLNGKERPEIFALHVSRNSYGWRGELEIARRPYFRVLEFGYQKIRVQILNPQSQDSKRIDKLLEDNVVPASLLRIKRSELAKYLQP